MPPPQKKPYDGNIQYDNGLPPTLVMIFVHSDNHCYKVFTPISLHITLFVYKLLSESTYPFLSYLVNVGARRVNGFVISVVAVTSACSAAIFLASCNSRIVIELYQLT